MRNFKAYETTRKILLASLMLRLKINGCAICGYDKCMRALHFHHVIPETKNFSLNLEGLHYSNERIANELNKCILLCSNCHNEIENKR